MKQNGKKRCRICKVPLPANARNYQVVCVDPDGNGKPTQCQAENKRRLSMEAQGYVLEEGRYVKKEKVQCDGCLDYFVPKHGLQKRHQECTQKAKNLANQRYRNKEKTEKEKNLEALQPTVDLRERICLGVMCHGEKTFMSKSPFNRVCERCTVAEGHVGGRYVTHTGHSPLSARHQI